MIFRKQRSIWLVPAFLIALFLVGCTSDSSNDNSPTAEFQLPGQVAALRLTNDGELRAYARIDSGSEQPMTISGSAASVQLTATEGSHNFTIRLAFLPTGGSEVTLAQSTKPLTVSASGTNTLSFAESDFDFTAFDDDNDGLSNLAELQSPQISAERTPGGTTTPILAYNSAGDGIAVWEVGGIGRSLLYSAYDSTTDTWSTEAVLQSLPNNNSMYPQLTSNGTGFALVWQEYDGTKYDLYASFYDGSSWSSPANIEALDTSANSPKIASNGTGYAVTWYQNDGSRDRVYANISSTGAAWDVGIIIDTTSSTQARYPAITSNGSGYAIAWNQDSPYRVAVSIYTGTWSTPVAVDAAGSYSASQPQIASNGSGYSVLWYEYDATRYNVLSNTYYDTGGGVFAWGGQLDLDAGNTYSAYTGSIDNIASNGTGYAITFYQQDASSYSNYARVNTNGDNSWGSATLLENDTGSIYNYASVAANDSAYAFIWSQYDGTSTYDLKANVYTSGFSGDILLESNSAPAYSGYKIAGNGSEFVASWIQAQNNINNLFANIYSSGNWGGASLIENGSGAVNSTPNVVASPSGSITVAWTQIGTGVFTNTYESSNFGGELALSTTSFGGSSTSPQLVSNGNGNIMALWLQDVGGNSTLYASIREDGVWGQPEVLSDPTLPISSSDIHSASNGNGFAVAWRHYDGSQNSVYARVFNGSTSTWNTTEEVDDAAINGDAYLVSNGYGSALASNGSSYMLVYRQYDESAYYDLYAREFDGSSWSTPQVLDDPAINNSVNTGTVASDGSGYMAAWYQYNSSYNFYGSEFDSGSGSWSTAMLIENGGSNYFYDYYPRLVSDGFKYLAVWSQYDGSVYRARGNFYSSGSWGTSFNLDSGSGYYVYGTPLAVANTEPGDIDGGFAVAWREYTGSAYDVSANVYTGTAWLGSAQLDDGSSGSISNFYYYDGFRTSLASSGSNYGVVWGRYDGSTYYDAYASLFSGSSWSTAESLESEDTNINDLQIAGDGDGFMVGWRHNAGTSGLYDVYFNRYASGSWQGETLLDDNDNSGAFSLSLRANSSDGYMATWIQAEPSGDAAVGYPWAMVGF